MPTFAKDKAVTNFDQRLPASQSDLAQQTLKDPYIFDFLTLEEPFHERELEAGLIRHLEKFLIELGQGFAFVGRQHRLDVGDEDYYIDLLFYHLRLRAFVVIDLKTGAFRPEYAGKLNFYCNVVNDRLRHETDAPTIGLILCQTKDNVLAEYSLTGIDKPIGVSSYQLPRTLPKNLRSDLPTVDQIEAELEKDLSEGEQRKEADRRMHASHPGVNGYTTRCLTAPPIANPAESRRSVRPGAGGGRRFRSPTRTSSCEAGGTR
jgi:predicted nuclease of restriction endonuclease-like (RecB) superfamily